MRLKLRKQGHIYYARGTMPYRELDGTLIRRRIEKSLRTSDHKQALLAARDLEREYWEAAYSDRPRGGTFAEAALLYAKTKGDDRFVQPLIHHFGSTPLSGINQHTVNSAAAKLYPKAKASTVNRQVFTPVIAIMNLAARQGWSRPPNLERPRGHNRVEPLRVPDESWFESILPYCRPRLAALIIFLTLTGRRIGEALSLSPIDVDIENGRATIKRTKTDEPFTVELASPVVAAIKQIENWQNCPRLFGYSSRSNVHRDIKKACARAGIQYFCPHVFGRHKFASRLLEAGYSLQFVKEAGQWKTIKMVAERYGHLERREVAKAVRAVGDKWGRKADIA